MFKLTSSGLVWPWCEGYVAALERESALKTEYAARAAELTDWMSTVTANYCKSSLTADRTTQFGAAEDEYGFPNELVGRCRFNR